MECSVLVCTRNRPEKLKACVAALLEADLGDSCEIVIVDQSDEASELEKQPILRYFWLKGKGLARARNQAIELARGNLLCFTDDDCLVAKDWLQNIQATFRAHPQADGVFGRVLAYARQDEQVVHHRKKTRYGEATYAEKPGPYFCSALFSKDEAAIYDQPCLPVANLGAGNNMSFRRSVFDRHGLFITYLGPGGWLRSADDTEFHYRLLRANCQLVYTPDVLVYHDNWIDGAQNARLQDDYRIGVVATWFYYTLKGDQMARSFLKHRWQGISNEIQAHRYSQGRADRIKFALKKRRAFAQGLLGGLALYLMSVLRPAALHH